MLFLKILLGYLFVGCLLSMFLSASGHMKSGCDTYRAKGFIHYIDLLLCAAVMPIVFFIALIAHIVKQQSPKA